MLTKPAASRGLAIAICMAVVAGPAPAVVVPDGSSAVAGKEYRDPDLSFVNSHRPLSELPAAEAALAHQDLAELGVPADAARVDQRGGGWGALLTSHPLLPGTGVGNGLRWDALKMAPPSDRAGFERAVRQAFGDFVRDRERALRIDAGELSPATRVTASDDGTLVQIHAPRLVGGVPVRDSYVTAVVNHGNLVLFGAHNWGPVTGPTEAKLSAEEAVQTARGYLDPLAVDGYWGKPELVLVPMARGHVLDDVALGQGHRYRPAWTVRPRLAEDPDGRWEVLVDARDGKVLLCEDTLHHATTREVRGGVYPVSNDGMVPDGVEQAGWPMPFETIATAGGTLTTDAGGNLPVCVDGDVTSDLSGLFVSMNDNCGAIGLTSAGDIDFGTSGGDDCVTPGVGGPGNTHSSRSGFFELNGIIAQAQAQLPNNTWLQQTLTANMNINNVCNAFWNGSTVNFYRSGGGCGNTGELAGVFDHEWGHGMDDNDVNPTISNPGEGIADLYAYFRLDTSCIGRGFRQGTACTGYGDPCVGSPPCDGVRDIDWANRASGQPHDVAWADPNCGAGSGTPCGGSTHCEGAVYAEAVFDLVNRDLPALFGMDHNTALEVGTRLTYLGGGAVGNWFQCVTPFGGCNADGGYLNYLAADDDNGNLNDGTPHMTAIFDAFDRHGIACNTPAVQSSGCAGTPTTAPVVNGTPLDRGASLTWNAVTGASEYEVFRTDGVFGCDFGKIKVGTTAGTSFVDGGLQNGRDYFYVVIPKGPSDSCFGPASACTTVTPVAGANLAVDESSASLALSGGDGDVFLDNCETGTWSFAVDNVGTGTQTNVRIVSVTSSNPGIAVTTPLPATVAGSLGECVTATGNFSFTAGGLSFGETVTFTVELTSDQLSPFTKSATFSVSSAESDLQSVASRTFSFESGTEGWTVVEGTFNRSNAGGGAQGTTWYEASSSNLTDQCDHIQSPVVSLTASSALELWNNFDIEPAFGGTTWYDRANLGIFEVDTGGRTPVDPDGGRLYNASGQFGTCGTQGQEGWADTQATWGFSSWSASALGSAGFAGRPVRLDVRYGTDFALQGFGFRFDQVTLTNFDEVVPDTQSDSCGCAVDADCDDGLFCNGAETCNAGTCQAGTPPDCDDGVGCTDDSCNETTDACDNVANDGNCANGLFCDGAETCDPVLDCQAGTPVDCDDGVGCTADACNEATDVCDNLPNDAACDDGLFCNGAETCDPVLDCQAGTDPCPGQFCDEGADVCLECQVDADCDDGLFCNGAETCNAGACQAGSDPCPGQGCDEGGDVCVSTQAQLESDCLVAGGTPTTVNLVNTYTSPVVVTSVQFANNTLPVVTRVSAVTGTSFDVRLQNPSGSPVEADNVCYLVVEEGTWNIDGFNVEAQTYLSTVTDDAPTNWVGEPQTYGQTYTDPVVLGQVMSENDPGFSVFWDMATTRTAPPSASVLTTGKTVCEDTDVTRDAETVGFVVIEAGHGTIGGVEFEAATGADSVLGVTNAPPYVYTFNTAFASTPTVATVQMAAVDGNNGGWAQVHGPTLATTTSLFLSIDEDQIADTERNHTNEQVAYAVFAGPVVFPAPGCAVDADCDNGLFCDGPETCNAGVCVAGRPPNCDDGVSCTADSCNEAADACDNTPSDAFCDDGLFCNGAETCDPVLDCQAGTDPCPGQTCDEGADVCVADTVIEWGTVNNVGTAPVTVNLTGSYTSPVIVTSVQYANNGAVPVVTRISSVTGSSFAVNLQNAGAGTPLAETVSYLVVEEGVHTVDGTLIEAQTYLSTVTDENNSWVGQARTLAGSFTEPVVVGQVMSTNDPDWSVFWDQGTARTNPPIATALTTGKTVCEDTLTTRADETVGFVVVEAGHGTLGGVEFEAALGADTVQGVGNAPPYTYTFNTPFASTPTVAVVTMAGVDGGNGGWAYVFGPSPTSATSLDLAIDEDTIGDSERSHITEQVGYVVFAAPGSASP